MTIRHALAALILCAIGGASASAQEPPWSRSVWPWGAEAEEIRQTPILHRPYRPGHFYGNTVRRMHYRGHPLPLPRDFFGWGEAAFE